MRGVARNDVQLDRLRPVSPPAVSKRLLRWFAPYATRYMRRHFHAVRLSRRNIPQLRGDEPAVVCLNHAAWWDPLLCLVLAMELFPERTHFAPIDADALKRYRFLSKLGFFGVERGTLRGTKEFLRTGQAILASPGSMLWVTAQGRFTDVRERPVQLQRGLGFLLARVTHGSVLPLAIEYPFWQERFPEALARFGPTIEKSDYGHLTGDEWTLLLSERLELTQDQLAADSSGQRAEAFDTIQAGSAGVSGVYDLWRRARSMMRGERFHREHGAA